MKCPSCGAASADGAAECPACGLIFAKWRQRLEEPIPSPPPPNRWIGRAIAAVVIVLWLLGFATYVYYHTQKRRPAPLQASLRGKSIGPFEIAPVRSLTPASTSSAVSGS